ncbi:MAG: DUF4156 domain-containing protein [Deltaproteobacteria bacterium]|nr:DUF4156 domain-containing protein [Deltaproteobacteria bacterium]
MMKKFLVIVFALSLLGCSVSLTPAGKKVLVRKGDPPPTCEFVDNVTVTGVTIDRAKDKMKNEAAEMGANWITYETVVSGSAYRCPDSVFGNSEETPSQ